MWARQASPSQALCWVWFSRLHNYWGKLQEIPSFFHWYGTEQKWQHVASEQTLWGQQSEQQERQFLRETLIDAHLHTETRGPHSHKAPTQGSPQSDSNRFTKKKHHLPPLLEPGSAHKGHHCAANGEDKRSTKNNDQQSTSTSNYQPTEWVLSSAHLSF